MLSPSESNKVLPVPFSTLSKMPSPSESKSLKFGIPSLSESVVPSVASIIPSPSESKSLKSGTPSLSVSAIAAPVPFSIASLIPSPSESVSK